MKKIKILPLALLMALSGCSNRVGGQQPDASSEGTVKSSTSTQGIGGLQPDTSSEVSVKDISTPDELQNLTDDELVALSLGSKKGTDSCAPLFEYRISNIVRSASSEEDAKEACREKFTDVHNRMTNASVVLDSELFYVLKVSWDYRDYDGEVTKYDGNVFCFKDEFAHLTIDERYNVLLSIKDFSVAQTLLDLFDYRYITEMVGIRILLSEIEEREDKYVYTNYRTNTCFGDWGVRDRIDLVKRTYWISKADGEVTQAGETVLQTAYGKMN